MKDSNYSTVTVEIDYFLNLIDVCEAAEEYFYSDPRFDPDSTTEERMSALSRLYEAVSAIDWYSAASNSIIICDRCSKIADTPRQMGDLFFCDPETNTNITCFENEWIGNHRNER